MREIDDLDLRLLIRVYEQPGKSIVEVVKPFLAERSLTTLRRRVRNLAEQQYLILDASKRSREVLCYPKRKANESLDWKGMWSETGARVRGGSQ
jgi:hypothetical protein